jgi:hypothetical protein
MLPNARTSLRSVAQHFNTKDLTKVKSLTVSDWASRMDRLSKDQTEYAADDARSSLDSTEVVLQWAYRLMKRQGVKSSMTTTTPASMTEDEEEKDDDEVIPVTPEMLEEARLMDFRRKCRRLENRSMPREYGKAGARMSMSLAREEEAAELAEAEAAKQQQAAEGDEEKKE